MYSLVPGRSSLNYLPRIIKDVTWSRSLDTYPTNCSVWAFRKVIIEYQRLEIPNDYSIFVELKRISLKSNSDM